MESETSYVQNGRFRFIVFVLCCFVLLSSLTCALYFYACTQKLRGDFRRGLPAEEGGAEDLRPALYTVREHEGIIGIWSADGTLSHTLDVRVASLPPADRGLLAAGFPIYSARELRAVIEDYTG